MDLYMQLEAEYQRQRQAMKAIIGANDHAHPLKARVASAMNDLHAAQRALLTTGVVSQDMINGQRALEYCWL
jgi:hypothetical protein